MTKNQTIRIKIDDGDGSGHKAQGRLEGQWIIFTCEHCPSWERRYDWQTGEMTFSKGTAILRGIQHHGSFFPTRAGLN
jgi:hypothetical protein